ncbi:MAG: hypothetical protein WKF63_07405, partial [Thermomicrobiales bacterium]
MTSRFQPRFATTPSRISRWRSTIVLAVASLIGLACFLYPFILPIGNRLTDENSAHASLAPLLFAAVIGVCLLAVLVTMA